MNFATPLLAAAFLLPGLLAADLPNVIIMVADDQGYEDLSSYGSERISSPAIDQLAAEGVRFTSYYTASSVCSPSRSAMMTGRYPKRCGVPKVLFPNSLDGLAAEEITLAEKFKERGYATACVGKWHMGHQPEFMPTNQGFDRYYGVPYSNDMSIAKEFEIASDVVLGAGCTPEIMRSDIARYLSEYQEVRNRVPLLSGNTIIEYPVDQRTLTGKYTTEALSFIRENRDGPFFLYLPQTMPHNPILVSENFEGSSKGGVYGDSIQEIDWSMGQIIAELKRLGIDQKTIVIYTSDNGAAAKGSSLPFKGKKFTTWEGGHRVPMIAWGPGYFGRDQVRDEIVTAMDFFPTFVSMIGGQLPADRVIDGKNILPLLKSEAGARSPHDAFLYYSSNSTIIDGIRQGDWKYLIKGNRQNTAKKPGAPDAYLFNLAEDVSESNNLIAQHPEKAEELRSLMLALDQAIPSPSR